MDIRIEKKKGIRALFTKKGIPYLAGALFLVFVLWLLLRDNSSTLRVDARTISVGQVVSGEFNDYIRVTGQVQPITTVQLSPLEAGIVERLVVEEGTSVKKGDVLVVLSNTSLTLEILNSEAELAEKQNILRNTLISMEQEKLSLRQDKAQLDLDVSRKKRAWQQNEELYRNALIAREEWLQSKEDYELAEKKRELNIERQVQDSLYRSVQIEQMEENLDNMKRNMQLIRERIGNLNVKSPIDGEVGLLDIVLGQSVSTGQKIGQINDLSDYKVEAQIDESYIDRVRAGLEATFDRQGTDYKVRLRKVYPEVRSGQFRADFTFLGDHPENIRSGQTYYLHLELGQPTEAVIIPRGSFYQTTGGAWIYVLAPEGDKAYKRPIRIGRQNPQYYEVLDGLEPGERVIVSGYENYGSNDVLILNKQFSAEISPHPSKPNNMFRQLNFRSFFNFLGRNKLYAAINIFGLSVSLMFVILIADYTLRQLTCDDYHAKADRIYVIGNEERITSGYYLQKYLRDRYPEIESTCAVAVSGQSTDAMQPVEAGQGKYSATILFADTTFFRIFDFELLEGDREQALASRDNVVLSESFARKVFGTFNPMGQVIRFPDEEKSYVVSGVVRDIDRSVIPNMDIIMRAERLCDINSANDERMSNSGAVTTFILARPGADLTAKIPDMLDYFKEIYWIYKGNVYQHVTLTPLRDVYFLSQNNDGGFNYGSWPFVMILFGVGAVILLFAVMNYINLTVAQTGFRAKEMAARRLLGASRGEIILKLILESTFLGVVAFVIALFLAAAVEPGASRLLGSKIGVWQDMTPAVVACYAAFIVVLGVVAGFIPAMMVSRYKPVDIVRGSFRHRTKMFYSKVLITIQNVITIVLIATSLTIGLQIRHLISAPMGYNTADILDVSTEIFTGKPQIAQFREELLREPCVEAVALGCGTPHDRGNNNTMQYGPDRMIGFQIFIGDSTYFRILGLERLRDNHLARMNDDNMVFINQHALRELGIAEDAEEFKVGMDYSYPYQIAGIYRDFQIGSALDKPQSAMLWQTDDIADMYPWNILVKIRGDKTAAYNTVKSVFERISDGAVFTGAEYIEQEIEADYAEQRRILHIVGIFTLVAILISALGLVAMSTYYIQQKEQEVAVRKVFGSTRGEVLVRLVGNFMRLVGAAFVLAVPVAWYLLERWLQDYSVRISLSPLIFLIPGAFAAAVAFVAVFWQSSRAADSNPVDSIKN